MKKLYLRVPDELEAALQVVYKNRYRKLVGRRIRSRGIVRYESKISFNNFICRVLHDYLENRGGAMEGVDEDIKHDYSEFL